jgi:hypothetical protein
MVEERELVTLLYGADWKRLNLTADISVTFDFDPHFRQVNGHAPRPPDRADIEHGVPRGIHRLGGRLVVVPGGRYRVEPEETPDPDDEPGLGHLGPEALLHPAQLLSGFTLSPRGPVTVSGRDAFKVVATPRPWQVSTLAPLDRIEAIVDAETGILLRRADIFDGLTLQLTELSQVRFGALKATDAAGFSDDDDWEGDPADPFGGLGGNPFDVPGWRAAKVAANAAGAVLGSAVRHSPHQRCTGAGPGGRVGDADAAMPADEPFGAGAPASVTVISDELPYAMYRSGTVPFTGTLHRWDDTAAYTDWLRLGADRRGWDGVGAFAGAVGDRIGISHRVWRVQTGRGGRYRIDYVLNPQKGRPPSTMACDGDQRWRVYENRVTVGPAGPVDRDIAAMVDASWLLRYELSDVTELTFGDRRAFAFRVASGEPLPPLLSPLVLSDTRAIVDAELGIVLLVESRLNGKATIRGEFRDVSATAAEDQGGAFRLDIPPGVRVVRHDGGPLNEIDVPEPVRVAARSARAAARMGETGFAAARGFLDSLRGTRPPRS